MKLTIVLLLFPLGSFAHTVWQTDYDKISVSETLDNGIQIDVQFAPYMALVYADNSFSKLPFCGAAIITTRHLISAAYFFYIHQNKHFKVVTGSTFAYPVEQQNYHEVKKVYRHEKYDPSEIYHNIALIELKDLLEFSYKVNLIKLMTWEDLNNTTEKTATMILTGFGHQENRTMSHLVEKSIKIRDSKMVELDSRLLVLNKVSVQTCFGDSGNPGVINGKLAALLIYEESCEFTDLPKFFTGIVYYYDWIRTYVGQERLEKYPDLN